MISLENFNTPVDKNTVFFFFWWDFNFSRLLLMRKYKRIGREGLIKLVKKGNCNFDTSVIRF